VHVRRVDIDVVDYALWNISMPLCASQEEVRISDGTGGESTLQVQANQKNS